MRMLLLVISLRGLQGSLFQTSHTVKTHREGGRQEKSKVPHTVYTECQETSFAHVLLDLHCSSSVRLGGQLGSSVVCGKANFLLVQHKLDAHVQNWKQNHLTK